MFLLIGPSSQPSDKPVFVAVRRVPYTEIEKTTKQRVEPWSLLLKSDLVGRIGIIPTVGTVA